MTNIGLNTRDMVFETIDNDHVLYGDNKINMTDLFANFINQY